MLQDYQTRLVTEGFCRRAAPIIVSAMGAFWAVRLNGSLNVQNPDSGQWHGWCAGSWRTLNGEFSYLPPWDFAEDREKALRLYLYKMAPKPENGDFERYAEWRALLS